MKKASKAKQTARLFCLGRLLQKGKTRSAFISALTTTDVKAERFACGERRVCQKKRRRPTVRESFSPQEIRYLKLLRKQYRTIQEASAEVAHLRAVLRLPKGTEHFLSDLHGEHAAFLHILHNASGVIKRKINDLYGDILSSHERDMLSTLIYYPDEKLALLKKQGIVNAEWYRLTIYRLLEVCRMCSVKYTRKRVRDAMPRGMGALMEEMLLSDNTPDKEGYYREVMQSILETGQSDAMIIALSGVIQALAIDRLHIIGDIFDRGPRADLIMDALENYHQVDVQWGNHDIAWMGAAALSEACIAQVIVTSVKYGNLETLEVGYGISLRPLATLAAACYADDPCEAFLPRDNGEELHEDEMELARMHKAAAILQFKLEGQLLSRHPEYRMDETSLHNTFVRMANGEMAPLSQFVTLTRSYGAETLSRFNMYNSIAVNAMPAEGYSTGDAIRAVKETAEISLPKGYGYDFGGITREENQQSGTTVIIFGICILMIYLILSALYESFIVPFAVILAVPVGLMGTFLFAKIAGLENNIYLQTGLIMLIGLLAKTAILLTEYAAERRKAGMGLIASAVSAAKARLRPILMTALTMIFGLFPLVVATGVGANGNRSLGTGVVGGMTIGTLALLFIVPALFVTFQWLQERLRPAQSMPTKDWQIEEDMEVSKKEIEEHQSKEK